MEKCPKCNRDESVVGNPENLCNLCAEEFKTEFFNDLYRKEDEDESRS